MNECENDQLTSYFESFIFVSHHKFKWKLENFSTLSKTIKLCDSDFQPAPGKYFYIEFTKETSFIRMYLCRENNKEIANGEIVIYLTDIKGKIYFKEHKLMHFNDENMRIDLTESLKSETLEEMRNLANDELIIIFDLNRQPIKMSAHELCASKFECENEQHRQVTRDLKKLLDDRIHSDVNLSVDGELVPAHKAILCARSPVLSKMIEKNPQDRENNVIKIEDVNPKTFKEFVSLLYCPQINYDLNFDALCDLYCVADKYAVLNLRDYISNLLFNRMQDNNNSLQLLALADRHNDVNLKLEVMNFVKQGFKFVVKYDSWKDFVINNGELAAVLMSEYFEENNLAVF